MCLGIPGRLVEFVDANDHLARADVSGVTRIINIGLLEDEALEPGTGSSSTSGSRCRRSTRKRRTWRSPRSS